MRTITLPLAMLVLSGCESSDRVDFEHTATRAAAGLGIAPAADTTIYQHATGNAGGADPEIWVGAGGAGLVFRGLLRFDLNDLNLPVNANPKRVTLTMEITNLPGISPVASTIELVALTSSWSEGTAPGTTNSGNACDDVNAYGGATWSSRDCNTNAWTTAGGDFAASASAGVPSGTIATTLTWDSDQNPGMLADINSWLETPASNFGWLMRSNAEGTPKTARRFASGSHPTAAHPALVVEYKLDNGETCADGAECESGFCAGTFCCNNACDAPDANLCQTATGATCATGECVYGALDVTACDDGSLCTVGDSCVAGACIGEPTDCDDGEICTADACAAETGACSHTPVLVATSCDDGDACTLTDSCVAGTCVGVPLDCNDADPCTTDSCDAGACSHGNASNGTGCFDNDACTANDSCTNGVCGGTALDCDDGNPCTSDSCAVGECLHEPVSSAVACDDGDTCTTNDTCSAGVCTGTPGGCDNDTPPKKKASDEGGCAATTPSVTLWLAGLLAFAMRRRQAPA